MVYLISVCHKWDFINIFNTINERNIENRAYGEENIKLKYMMSISQTNITK